ncbi:ferritin [bacterium]|nr:ferritin [bacterium]
MGTKARELLGKNVDKIVKLLNKAFADEWLAYYQYWIGAKVVEGPMKNAAIAELMEHAADELRHAEMLSERIIQLGGTPPISPKEWLEQNNCGYDAPEDPYVLKILDQNIKGEQCAIDVYNALMRETKESDPVTYNIALEILTDELEHEEDLQALKSDFNHSK